MKTEVCKPSTPFNIAVLESIPVGLVFTGIAGWNHTTGLCKQRVRATDQKNHLSSKDRDRSGLCHLSKHTAVIQRQQAHYEIVMSWYIQRLSLDLWLHSNSLVILPFPVELQVHERVRGKKNPLPKNSCYPSHCPLSTYFYLVRIPWWAEAPF